MPPVKRPTPVEARRILAEELAGVGWDAVSAFTVEDGARPNTESLDWWHRNTPPNESSETARNLAYLRAYVKIAGGDRLYAGGIPLSRRRLWMDRSVISRLERDGFLRFVSEGSMPWFELTDKGRAWTAEQDALSAK